MEKDLLRTVAHRGLALGQMPLLRYQANGRQALREGVSMIAWGPAGASFNKAAVLGPSPPLARICELAEVFFGSQPDAYGILVEADAGHPVEAELRAAGWKVLEDEPALVLADLSALPPDPAGVEIRPVRDDQGRRDFIKVAAAGFGDPTSTAEPVSEEVLAAFGPSLPCALDPDVAVLVGYVDGQPVSSAMFYRVAEIACITGVATVPTFRRHGLARALTWAAVRIGAERGCTCSTLGAFGASFELYQSMGFVHVCNHRLYGAVLVTEKTDAFQGGSSRNNPRA